MRPLALQHGFAFRHSVSTFALSVIGLVLAVVANLWNIGLTFVRSPRLAVETRTHIVLVLGGRNRHRIEVTVMDRSFPLHADQLHVHRLQSVNDDSAASRRTA